jgi:flagellar protein FliS
MNAATTANTYKTQQVMTASPEELTLMLYNGAIRFVNECILATQAGNLEKAHVANLRAQDIVREFMSTLDMQYELSQNWMVLYAFVEQSLIQGNIKKQVQPLEDAKTILVDLRTTWVEAMKLAKGQQQVAVAR